MAKTITLVECPAPTNPTATPVAGGSLAAGTYYYRVVAVGPGSNYYGGDSAMFWASIPSAEVSATTDATNGSIEVYWDNPVDSNGLDGEVFMIFRTTVSGDYDAYKGGTIYKHLLTAGSGAKGYGATKSQLTAVGSGFKYTDDGSDGLRACPLIEDGVPCFEIEGGDASDPITPEDLYNWAVTNSKTYCIAKWDAFPGVEKAIAIRTVASIRQPQPGTTDLYFSVPNRTYFLQQWGKTWFDTDGHFISGKNTTFPTQGGVWQRLSLYAWYSGTRGDFELYEGTMIGSPREAPYSDFLQSGISGQMMQFRTEASLKIYNSLYEGRGANATGGRIAANNTDLQGNNLEVRNLEIGSPTANIDDCKITNVIKALYNVRQSKIQNSTFVNTGTNDYLGYNISADYDQVSILENITYANTPPVIKGNIVHITDTAWQVMLENYTVDIRVIDEDNNPIQGASIAIKDKDGYGAIWMDSGETLAENISIGETDWTVSNGATFSIGDYIKVNKEVLLITNIASNVLTVTRAQEGTEDRQYYTGQKIFLRHNFLSTDANGEISTMSIIRRTYWLDPSEYTTTGTKPTHMYDHSDHIVTIKKAGYLTYKQKFTISEKKDWTITLKHSPYMQILGL